MFGYRTPKNSAMGGGETETEPSPPKNEAGKASPLSKLDTTRTVSKTSSPQSLPKGALVSPSKPKTKKTASQGLPPAGIRSRRAQTEVTVGSPELDIEITKPKGRLAEAKCCVMKAKLQINNSRNIKTEIKVEVLRAVDRLYQLVKEAEAARPPAPVPTVTEMVTSNDRVASQTNDMERVLESDLAKKLEEHGRMLRENTEHMSKLKEQMTKLKTEPRPTTYASVTAAASASQPVHSMVVSSADIDDTSEDVIQKIRKAVDAKSSGIRVDRLRKAKERKVVLGCQSKDELAKVTKKLQSEQPALLIEQKENKDPLVILKNVLSVNTDDDIIAALRSQNAHILGDIPEADYRATVRYRRKARNPHECHVVLRVSPRVWQCLTLAGRVHVDLQRVQVCDQSPLLQCSRCLAYGHGRKSCTETADLCSHCTGPHLRKDCPLWRAGDSPICRNCTLSKLDKSDHNSFDNDCPVRKKWDRLVRVNVAYC